MTLVDVAQVVTDLVLFVVALFLLPPLIVIGVLLSAMDHEFGEELTRWAPY